MFRAPLQSRLHVKLSVRPNKFDTINFTNEKKAFNIALFDHLLYIRLFSNHCIFQKQPPFIGVNYQLSERFILNLE
jgi:hypothetical protein